ncbi:MAG TPA: FAD:protein FMN transferase [Spirochaetia bacterium]|nr:FAD:protein FMN transferase [Spirochaetia bacterium]
MTPAPNRFHRSASLGAVILALVLVGCAGNQAKPESKTDFVLDTACTITIYDKAPQDTLTKAFDLLRHVNSTMTIDGTDSELIDVNNAAGLHPVEVSADTYGVIKDGLYYSRLTDGAFDITVGPLVKLWGIGRGGDSVPPQAKIREALSLVDYRNVALDDATHSVYLKRKGMVIDLGGIAKGYAGEAVEELLQKGAVRHAIVDLGGNIIAIGTKVDGSLWRIGIQDPDRARGSYIGVVSVENKAVVTSGKYERYFVYKGKRYHHILSTKTGFPVENGIASVTIISANSTTADALSTSLFLLGVQKGISLIDSIDQTEAIIVTEDKKIYVSGGLNEKFRISDPEYTLSSPISVPAS